MSLLTMIQNAALEQGLPRPESVIGSSDVTTRQMLAIANRTMKEVRGRAWWPKMTKTHTITLVAGTTTYAMPTDIDRQIHRTHWNRNRQWELIGPLTPQEYQTYISGTTQAPARQRFRIKGWADEQFEVFPTPASGDAGQIIAFEYQSTTTCRPRSWVTLTAYLAGEYVSNDGYIYSTILGGVSGATTPTWTTGSDTDGGITWQVVTSGFPEFIADTDVCLFDEDVIGLGVQWRFMQQKGLSYEKIEQEFEKAVQREITAEIGARTLSLCSGGRTPFLSNLNIPDTGFGV